MFTKFDEMLSGLLVGGWLSISPKKPWVLRSSHCRSLANFNVSAKTALFALIQSFGDHKDIKMLTRYYDQFEVIQGKHKNIKKFNMKCMKTMQTIYSKYVWPWQSLGSASRGMSATAELLISQLTSFRRRSSSKPGKFLFRTSPEIGRLNRQTPFGKHLSAAMDASCLTRSPAGRLWIDILVEGPGTGLERPPVRWYGSVGGGAGPAST